MSALKVPHGEALREGIRTQLFAQCLVQWVLTWSCLLVAIAVQTFNNKELASSAAVKLSYQICFACSLRASTSTGVTALASSTGLPESKENSALCPSSFSSGVRRIGQHLIWSFLSFVDVPIAVGRHFWEDKRLSADIKYSHVHVFTAWRTSSWHWKISAGQLLMKNIL